MENEKLFNDSLEMRKVIESAFKEKVSGSWSGSRHCYHAQGILRNGILFTAEYNVNNYCEIEISENPDAEWAKADNLPAVSNARAKPTPKDCLLISVWWSGGWRKKGPWCKKIDDVLSEIIKETEVKRAERIKNEENENMKKEKMRAENHGELCKSWE